MLWNILFLLIHVHFFYIRILFFRPRLNSYSHFSADFRLKIRRSMSVHWLTCGTCYSKKEGTELGGIEVLRSSQFFQVGGHWVLPI